MRAIISTGDGLEIKLSMASMEYYSYSHDRIATGPAALVLILGCAALSVICCDTLTGGSHFFNKLCSTCTSLFLVIDAISIISFISTQPLREVEAHVDPLPLVIPVGYRVLPSFVEASSVRLLYYGRGLRVCPSLTT